MFLPESGSRSFSNYGLNPGFNMKSDASKEKMLNLYEAEKLIRCNERKEVKENKGSIREAGKTFF